MIFILNKESVKGIPLDPFQHGTLWRSLLEIKREEVEAPLLLFSVFSVNPDKTAFNHGSLAKVASNSRTLPGGEHGV